MALDVTVDSLNDVPESLHDQYEERDGHFVLQLNGAYSRADRDALKRSLDASRSEFKDTKSKLAEFGEHTPDGITELIDRAEDLKIQLDLAKKEGGPSDEDISALVEQRLPGRVRPLERQIEKLASQLEAVVAERDGFSGALKTGRIQAALTSAVSDKAVGITSDALPDVELWGSHVFEEDEAGNIVSKDVNGITPGLSPLDVLKDMRASGQRRHWFGQTAGAGATGGPGVGVSGDNPFKLEKNGKPANITAAAMLIKNDFPRAKRLAQAAGEEALAIFPMLRG